MRKKIIAATALWIAYTYGHIRGWDRRGKEKF
jgi:hypothetical protein